MNYLKVSVILLVLTLFPTILLAKEGTISMKIKGLSCPFCVYGVEKKLKKVPGVLSVSTNYKQSKVTIKIKEGLKVDHNALRKAIIDSGFTVDSIDEMEQKP